MTTPVQQSGAVTPTHLALWTTDGVIQDGGPWPGSQERVLGRFLSANFNTTNDQQIPIPTSITAFQLTRIIVTNANVSLTTAAGGFYPNTGKAGSAIVAAGQAYSALTTAAGLLNPTLTSFASTTRFSQALTNLTSWSIYLSLTTGQGVAVTADVYLVGVDLTPSG